MFNSAICKILGNSCRVLTSTSGGVCRAPVPATAKLAYYYSGLPLAFKRANANFVSSSGNLCHVKVSFQVQTRCFRTSPSRNALHPFITVLLGRLARMGAVVFGRSLQKWWGKLPLEGKVLYAAKVRRKRYILLGLLGAAAFGSFVYYEQHLQVTPITNRKRFIAFTKSQIMELSKLLLDEFLKEHEEDIIPASAGSAKYERVVKVVERLRNGNQDLSQIHDLKWEVTVVDDDYTGNAMAYPCGHICVYTGMLEECDSDDQLGFILAHEMAHAIMGHGAEAVSFMHIVDWLLVIPLAALWALVPFDMASVVHWISLHLKLLFMNLPRSRFLEDEADKVGLVLAAKACFDIRDAPVFWAKMNIMESKSNDNDSNFEWLSTHPCHENRQVELEKMLPEVISVREKCQCPRLPALDPNWKIEAYEKGMNIFSKAEEDDGQEALPVPVEVGDEDVKCEDEDNMIQLKPVRI